jgi:adenosylcobinamide kinase / adenosylcobinamide-phosphate guanylyltransferase
LCVVEGTTLITGGARSGKSAYALKLAAERPGVRRAYVATGEASDEEMAARIARHKAERPADFATIEEPVKLTSALQDLSGSAEVVIIDSLTLWVSNLMGIYSAEEAFRQECLRLAQVLGQAPFDSIIVTDEVGSGIVPDNVVARRFRDRLGCTNQCIAQAAREVFLMVSGYPLKVK